MSTKEQALLDFWFRALWAACQKQNNHVSAARVAKEVGQSRATALKYIKAMKDCGVIDEISVRAKNKMDATLYAPMGGW
jgi:response regulator of citrate/malate metabolism